MAITILPPQPAAPLPSSTSHKLRSQSPVISSDEDLPDDLFLNTTRPTKPPRPKPRKLLTPGETITADPQWMRGHGTTIPPSTDTGEINPPMISTVAGTLSKTNKLLSVTPLHARYQPSIGDLVVGRIVSISATGKRWNVDIAAPLLASLPLSAINLPGGVLRRKTAVDELNVRSFFAEGDLLVAEVQDVRHDGSAGLHTRSLKYGKLRNGMFMAVRAAGGGREGGVVRSRKQISVLEIRGGGKVDVILGVNGFVFVCAHIKHQGDDDGDEEDTFRRSGNAGVARREEEVSMRMYASANDVIDVNTRREIARVSSVVRVLAEKGVRVDEAIVKRGYEVACDIEDEGMEIDGEEGGLGGKRGARLVEEVLGGR